jgi:hypothetical protein
MRDLQYDVSDVRTNGKAAGRCDRVDDQRLAWACDSTAARSTVSRLSALCSA